MRQPAIAESANRIEEIEIERLFDSEIQHLTHNKTRWLQAMPTDETLPWKTFIERS
jgi:hypothetical protein